MTVNQNPVRTMGRALTLSMTTAATVWQALMEQIVNTVCKFDLKSILHAQTTYIDTVIKLFK